MSPLDRDRSPGGGRAPGSLALAAALLCPGLGGQSGTTGGGQPAPELAVIGTVTPGFAVAQVLISDLLGDGGEEVVVIGRAGEVRVLDPKNGALCGSFALPHPDRSLVALAAIDGDRRQHLIVYSPDGMLAFAPGEGSFAGPPRRLLRRGRFALRVGQPREARLAQDVNGDGRPDLVVPGHTDCTLYLNTAEAGTGRAKFIFASELKLRVSSESDTRIDPLSRNLDHGVSIPGLRTTDVNGDGRGDLVATLDDKRLYHLQRADGAFPAEPDVVLDLSRFRDTTPKANLEFGETLAQERAMLHTQDLDGDGIPDYIIAHRRKVWIYHGTDKGPQFDRPSKILILAEDVTFLLLMHLDEDRFPDLLVFKLQVPSLAALFLGLFADWDVKIRSVGYASLDGKTFAPAPKWRGETIIRVPSLMSLIRNPEAIVRRFTEVGRKFRHGMTADLDGDRTDDVLMQSEDNRQLRFWLMQGAAQTPGKVDHRRYRALLFEDENNVWDVDRILQFIRSMADDRFTRMTRGREPAGAFTLRDPEQHRLELAAPADLDGDGRSEIVLLYLGLRAPHPSTIEILRLRP